VNLTSTSLLARVRVQDQAAWERLVTLYSPLVFRWCQRAGLQPVDAADVGQEVFAAVARNIQNFRHDRPGDTFRGWLFTITRNKLRDRLPLPPGGAGAGGSDAQRQLAQVPAEESGESEEDADDERKLLYRRAVDLISGEFEPRTWQAFWRVAVDGQRPEDVAGDLRMTVNAVYLAKSRVLRRLREEFALLID
jgi:RNA polymerase sigma-70 factor (ECF subfamily)